MRLGSGEVAELAEDAAEVVAHDCRVGMVRAKGCFGDGQGALELSFCPLEVAEIGQDLTEVVASDSAVEMIRAERPLIDLQRAHERQPGSVEVAHIPQDGAKVALVARLGGMTGALCY